MYNKIKEEIKDQYYQSNFSNDGQKFIAWYLRKVLLRDLNETREDITDGQNDKQIDAIVIDTDNNIVHIIQGKFYSGEYINAEPLRELLSAFIQTRDLEKLQINGNIKLKRKLYELSNVIENDDYKISFELITTSKLNATAQKDFELLQQEINEIADNDDMDISLSVIDGDELQKRYELALVNDNPQLEWILDLTDIKYTQMYISETQVLLAAIPLKNCLELPGLKNGSLFQKNVRQYLGNNSVNKGIKQTILGDKNSDFFFFHNGITALCKKMEIKGNELKIIGLSVVNGCQSLNTILDCSLTVKKLKDAYILFRFYEIQQHERAERISSSTNSQTVVRPRDFRSNDKRVLALKRNYENKYNYGEFLTKRGEQKGADKKEDYVIDLSIFAKCSIAWYSQRPNLSYGETKIFDKYFETLFRKDYLPENVYALNYWFTKVLEVWDVSNPLNLNDTLLAMKAYAPYHHLYAISIIFGIINKKIDRVPSPSVSLEKAKESNLIKQIIEISGRCLNTALKVASNRQLPENRVFSPQNWVKSKTCLNDINAAVEQYFDMLPMMENMQKIEEKLREGLTLMQDDFEYRLSAD